MSNQSEQRGDSGESEQRSEPAAGRPRTPPLPDAKEVLKNIENEYLGRGLAENLF